MNQIFSTDEIGGSLTSYPCGGDMMNKDKNHKKELPIQTDPNGSYTGRPADPYEKPVQDADDL